MFIFWHLQPWRNSSLAWQILSYDICFPYLKSWFFLFSKMVISLCSVCKEAHTLSAKLVLPRVTNFTLGVFTHIYIHIQGIWCLKKIHIQYSCPCTIVRPLPCSQRGVAGRITKVHRVHFCDASTSATLHYTTLHLLCHQNLWFP